MMEINTSVAGSSRPNTDETIKNFLNVLQNACLFSSQIALQMTKGGMLQIIESLLIHNEGHVDEDRSKAQHSASVIGLLQAILPMAIEEETEETKEEDKSSKRAIMPEESELSIIFPRAGLAPQHQKQYLVASAKVQKEKRQFVGEMSTDEFNFLVHTLMPRIFFSYARNPAKQFRFKCLQTIEKILFMAPPSALQIAVDPDALATFTQSIFESENGQQILINLRMLKKVLTANGLDFGLPLIRAGIAHQIE